MTCLTAWGPVCVLMTSGQILGGGRGHREDRPPAGFVTRSLVVLPPGLTRARPGPGPGDGGSMPPRDQHSPKRTIAFLNIGMHGRVNPTLPVVAELVRRGHAVTYHTSPAFRAEIEATGATVCLYPGGDRPLPDPPTPARLVAALAGAAVELLPAVLADLRRVRPRLIVHDSACPWGAVAARELGVPAVSSFTTFAFNRR